MVDDGEQQTDDGPRDGPVDPREDQDAMRELRRLLLGAEQDDLQRIHRRLDRVRTGPEYVSELLPSAVRLSNEKGEQLAEALAPTIDDSIRKSVRDHPERLVDAIFPVMGPAIRKSIIDTLGRMLQSLNQTMAHSLSPRSIAWRLEARRTGKSFAEVVLLKTLQYRVEQAFLIHCDNGLLLQHVFSDKVAVQDGDMVSGMLSAIQDFIRDSFGSAQGDTLDQMKVDELQIWIRRGRHALLAIVIRGEHPAEELKEELDDAVRQVHADLAEELEDFPKSGDAAPFSRARPTMERLLREQKAEEKRRVPWMALTIVLIVLALAGYWIFLGTRDNRRWAELLDQVVSEPGLVVTRTDEHEGKRRLIGLRDPLAADPQTFVAASNLNPESIEMVWSPFHSAEPAIALQRARLVLEPPANVILTLKEGRLVVQGPAGDDWMEHARRIAPTIAGITGLDEGQHLATDPAKRVLAQAGALLRPPAGITLGFENGILHASGKASQRWIEEARLLARSLPQVGQYVDRDVVASDVGEMVLESAQRLLAPPDTVALTFEGGVLTATGKATEAWVTSARILARTIAGVNAYRESNLIVSDRPQRLLARARQLLQPPDTITLNLSGDDLIAEGTASTQWLDDARLLSRAVEGVSRFDDAKVTVNDKTERIIDTAMKTLRPPLHVTLTFVDGTLKAQGLVTPQWAAAAAKLAGQIPGVSRFEAGPLEADDAAQQLARVKEVLAPPKEVTLSLVDGVLHAKGPAPQEWIERARIIATVLPGVRRLDDSNLVASDREQRLLDRAILLLRPPAGVELQIAGRSIVARGAAPHAWILDARRLAPLVTGIDRIDDSVVVDLEVRRLTETAARITRRAVFFQDNSTNLAPDEERNLGLMMSDLRMLIDDARTLDRRITFEVVGHTDATGQAAMERNLSQSRADFLTKAMVQNGIAPQNIKTLAAGSSQPLPDSPSQRRVSVRVVLPD